MARTSKRYETKTTKKDNLSYKAGIYTRLSNERSESYREKSCSIETQILSCKEYALRENIDIVDVYTDYEYSGTNFERPAFIKMMEDIRLKRINCIIIRDLSRLGREHLEMGRLIDKVFPFLGVRFISVNDKVDTVKEADSKKSFEISIKNIINDMYAKDISVKIKSTKMNRAKNGYFIGSVPPYGYKIKKTKKGQILELDENTAPIVREIFDLTLRGLSQYEVAKRINKKGYSTPMRYFHTGRIFREADEKQWNKNTISKMLVKPIYYGTLVQGTKSQNLAKGEKQRRTDVSERIIVENAVEPIITYGEHLKVMEGRRKRLENSCFKANYLDVKRDPENRYGNKVVSYYNEKSLYRRTRIYKAKNYDKIYYVYRNDTQTGSIDVDEKPLSIQEKKLDENLVSVVSDLISRYSDRTSLTERLRYTYKNILDRLNKDHLKNLRLIDTKEVELKKAYEKYKDGSLDIDKYRLTREVLLNHIQILKDEDIRLKDKKIELEGKMSEALDFVNALYDGFNQTKLSKELIDVLVDKIIVKDSNTFEIIFNLDELRISEDREVDYE